MSKSFRLLIAAMFIFTMSFQAFADEAIINSRIIGGTKASQGDYPFQVGLLEVDGNSYGQFCGGTLISAQWVVTAAHCLESYSADYIGYGNVDWTEATRVKVSATYVHEDYDRANTGIYDNDIALLKLSSSVSASPIDYLSTSANTGYAVGTLATVIGWGDTNITAAQTFPDLLMEVDVPVVSDSICEESYGDSLTSNMVCAGYTTGGYDACQGDSGGPLFVVNSDDTKTLIGIVSFGQGCAQPDYYGVYTKVSKYKSWIESKTGITISSTGTVDSYLNKNIDVAIAAADATSAYDVDTSTTDYFTGSFTDSGDAVSLYTYTLGGAVESYAIANSAETLEALYATKAKLDVTIDTDGDKDVAFVVQFPNGDADDYYIIKCLANIGNMATCEAIDEVTYNSEGKWAMVYLDNNDAYDANQYGVTSDSRALGDDKIETTIYLARDYNVDDVVDAITGGGGGGGCTASGEGSPLSIVALFALCFIYMGRRKLAKLIK